MNVRYDKLIVCEIEGQARLVVAPEEFGGEHELVLVRRTVAGAEIRIILEARAGGERGSQPEACAAAAKRKAYGVFPLQAPSPEEVFLCADRSVYPSLPKKYFPDIEDSSWTWTDQVDAEDPSDYAWAVNLDGGISYRDRQSYHGRVRAVCPSQDLLVLGEEA